MKKIFVTGADGFIGSHLVESLVKKNFQVKALVLYNHMNRFGWLDNIDIDIKNKIDIVSGDIRDYNFLKNSTKGADIIVNLAALIGIPYSYEASHSYLETNIIGTHNILNASIENSIGKVIQTSTSEVYGSHVTKNKLKENSFQYAQSPYAASKIASDQLCNSYYSTYDLPVTIIRPFNTFGPRQSIRAIIPTIICQILDGNKSVKLGNTNSYRDFNYVSDTIDSFLKIINSKKNLSGEAFNVGSSYQLSMKDLTFLIADLMNVDIKIIKDSKRVRPKKSEVMSLLANNSRVKTVVSWKPRYFGRRGLIEGLKITIDWFKNNRQNYYNYKDYVK